MSIVFHMFRRKENNRILKWSLSLAAIFLFPAAVLAGAYFVFEKIHAERIYPGVYVGDIDVGGLTAEAAKKIFYDKADRLNQSGIVFRYRNRQAALFPLVASLESDLAYQLVNFDIDRTIGRAYAFGRDGGFYRNLRQKIGGLIYGKSYYVIYALNEEEVNKFLTGNFSALENQAEDARLVPVAGDNKTVKFEIIGESLGEKIDYDAGLRELNLGLSKLDGSPVYLSAKTDYPEIYENDCLNIENDAEKIARNAPVTMAYGENRWTVGRETVAGWLKLKLNPLWTESDSASFAEKTEETENPEQPLEEGEKKKVVIALDKMSAGAFLEEKIVPAVNRKPLDGKLEIKDGRVVEFQASRDGLELNIDATVARLEHELIVSGKKEVAVEVKELKSALRTEDINDLGIKEIIGIGESNFSGSPKNRRHNIAVGGASLNGVLVKPDEEFSLLAALGEIDGEAGYLPELVIKENRTVPEYGGGLCQIGTTMFRAALATGLPITMRRNHSYRVSYYEPAGTDATIYNPWPDMKFINDTEHHILIQTRIEGDNLYFDFWGTADGRKIEKTDPAISNIVRPGPTKVVETLDLPPGTKKCTEHAHNGADAYFDYKVTYSDGTVKEKTFTSHYVPWREVCLLGVEKLSTDTATSTEEKIP